MHVTRAWKIVDPAASAAQLCMCFVSSLQVQIHEPILVAPEGPELRTVFETTVAELSKVGVSIHLVTYYDDVGEAYPWVVQLPVSHAETDNAPKHITRTAIQSISVEDLTYSAKQHGWLTQAHSVTSRLSRDTPEDPCLRSVGCCTGWVPAKSEAAACRSTPFPWTFWVCLALQLVAPLPSWLPSTASPRTSAWALVSLMVDLYGLTMGLLPPLLLPCWRRLATLCDHKLQMRCSATGLLRNEISLGFWHHLACKHHDKQMKNLSTAFLTMSALRYCQCLLQFCTYPCPISKASCKSAVQFQCSAAFSAVASRAGHHQSGSAAICVTAASAIRQECRQASAWRGACAPVLCPAEAG